MSEEKNVVSSQEANEANSKSGFSKFTAKYKELWKFIKFSFAGMGSSLVELLVHLLLTEVIFASIMEVPLVNGALNYIGVDTKGYLYSYLISTTVGYTIAFVLNRKITFKADSNIALSTFLYVLMVIFTIFANAWIGSNMGSFQIAHGWNTGIGNLIAKVICMAIPTLWTYPLNRFVIHRHKKPAEAATEE